MSKLTKFTTNIRAKLLITEYKTWLIGKESVLDVGCGDGILSKILVDTFGVKLTGCDIKNYLQTDIPFIQMKDTSVLPAKSRSFDIIFLNDVLHHLSYENQINILKESLRVAPKVLIFEVQPTLLGAISDYTINKFHDITMDVPLSFRSTKEWVETFKKINVTYSFREPAKPLLYPFTHQAFLIKSKK